MFEVEANDMGATRTLVVIVACGAVCTVDGTVIGFLRGRPLTRLTRGSFCAVVPPPIAPVVLFARFDITALSSGCLRGRSRFLLTGGSSGHFSLALLFAIVLLVVPSGCTSLLPPILRLRFFPDTSEKPAVHQPPPVVILCSFSTLVANPFRRSAIAVIGSDDTDNLSSIESVVRVDGDALPAEKVIHLQDRSVLKTPTTVATTRALG